MILKLMGSNLLKRPREHKLNSLLLRSSKRRPMKKQKQKKRHDQNLRPKQIY